MSREIDNPQKARHLRGMVLRLIYLNHNAGRRRLTNTVIEGTLRREGWPYGGEEIVAMLQDLKDRGYVDFQSMRIPGFPNVHLFDIELRHHGRDLCDGLTSDAAVQPQ